MKLGKKKKGIIVIAIFCMVSISAILVFDMVSHTEEKIITREGYLIAISISTIPEGDIFSHETQGDIARREKADVTFQFSDGDVVFESVYLRNVLNKYQNELRFLGLSAERLDGMTLGGWYRIDTGCRLVYEVETTLFYEEKRIISIERLDNEILSEIMLEKNNYYWYMVSGDIEYATDEKVYLNKSGFSATLFADGGIHYDDNYIGDSYIEEYGFGSFNYSKLNSYKEKYVTIYIICFADGLEYLDVVAVAGPNIGSPKLLFYGNHSGKSMSELFGEDIENLTLG